jgi:hypothetical protein
MAKLLHILDDLPVTARVKNDVHKAILQWINEEIIGENEETSYRELTRSLDIDDADRIHQYNSDRNSLRAEMRKKLK